MTPELDCIALKTVGFWIPRVLNPENCEVLELEPGRVEAWLSCLADLVFLRHLEGLGV